MSGVLTQVSVFAVGYAGLVALAAAYAALRWRARPPWLASLAWMLEFLVGLRALLGLLALTDDRPDEPATYLGYLVASVCVLPLALQSVEDDHGAWSLGVVGVLALAVAVISLRMMATL